MLCQSTCEEITEHGSQETLTQQEFQQQNSIPSKKTSSEIKMMDTITFGKNFAPQQWIFTDLLGKIQIKDIGQISINEVIKAFLINLDHNRKQEFQNDDLLKFLERESAEQKICFAIKGSRRELLNINDLMNLKRKYPSGLDALQLYKIPTRSFLPFFFNHILVFDQMGNPLRSTLLRLPILEIQRKLEKEDLDRFVEILVEKTESIQNRIQQISNDIVARLTDTSPVVLLNITIVYLLEDGTMDPWFIGTDKCEVLTQEIVTHKKLQKRGKKGNQIKYADKFKANPIMQSSVDQHEQSNNEYQSYATKAFNKHYPGTTQSTTTVFQKLDSRQLQSNTSSSNKQMVQVGKPRPQTSIGHHYNSATTGIGGSNLYFQGSSHQEQSGQVQIDNSRSSKSNFFQFSMKNEQHYNSNRQMEQVGNDVKVTQAFEATKMLNVSDDSDKNEEPLQIAQNQSLSSKWFPPNQAHPYQVAKNAKSAKHLTDSRAYNSELVQDISGVDQTRTQSQFKFQNIEPMSTTISTISCSLRQPAAVYLLNSNELLTEDELYVGLTKIANEYGRPNSRSGTSLGCRGKSHSNLGHSRKLIQKARNNLIRSAVRNKDNCRDPLHQVGDQDTYSQTMDKSCLPGAASSKRTRSSTRVKNFIDRQNILHKYKAEFEATRQSLKPSGQRLIEVFPQFVDKAGSKQHSQFLFGNSNARQVFRDFKNAMVTKESEQLFNADMHAPKPLHETESLILQYQRQNNIPHQVFDIKATDKEEIDFFNKVFDQKKSSNVLQNTHLQWIQDRPQTANNEDLQAVSDYKGAFSDNRTKQKSNNPVLTHSDYDIFTDVPVSQDVPSKEDQASKGKAQQSKGGKSHIGRDFLAESLAEQRQKFNALTDACGLSQLESSSIKLIGAQKELEGVAVLDQEQVILNFKERNKMQLAEAQEYNFIGEIPIVNPELAEKYLHLKRTMREQKEKEKFEQSAINQSRENMRAISVQKKRKIIGSVAPAAAKQNRRFLRVSGHEIDTILTSKGKSTPRESVKAKNQKKFVRENSSKVRLVPVDLNNHTPDKNPTIEQDNMSQSAVQDEIKCSLSLFCAKQDIKLSAEMSLDDVCYISKKELERAKQYLAQHGQDDTLLDYSNQFNSFQNGIAQKPATQQDAATGQETPLEKQNESGLRFSRNSTENRTQLLIEQSASRIIDQQNNSLDGQTSEVPEQPKAIENIENKLAELKNQNKSLYKQQKEESVSSRLKSTEPLEKRATNQNEDIVSNMFLVQGDYKEGDNPRLQKKFQTTELSDGQAKKRGEESDMGCSVDPELSPLKPLNEPLKPLGPNSIVLGSDSEKVAFPSMLSTNRRVYQLENNPVFQEKE